MSQPHDALPAVTAPRAALPLATVQAPPPPRAKRPVGRPRANSALPVDSARAVRTTLKRPRDHAPPDNGTYYVLKPLPARAVPIKPQAPLIAPPEPTIKATPFPPQAKSATPVRSQRYKRQQQLTNTLVPDANDKLRSLPSLPNIDLHPNNIKKLQQADRFCVTLTNYILHNVKTDDKDHNRWLYLNGDKFVIIHNILFEVSEKRQARNILKLVLPLALKPVVLQMFHDINFSGHHGISNTLKLIKEHFYWYHMNSDVVYYVQSCSVCASARRGQRHARPPLTVHDRPMAPFTHLGIDALKCPKTSRGNTHIQVVVDYFSKFVILWPTTSLSGADLAIGFNNHVICQHGSCVQIRSDNGSDYTSRLFRDLCSIWNIKQKFASAFRPQSTGLVERKNRSILAILRSFTSKHKENWDLLLQVVAFALNSTPSFATGHTPFLLANLRTPINPYLAHTQLLNVEGIAPSILEQYNDRVTLQTEVFADAARHSEVAQAKMK